MPNEGTIIREIRFVMADFGLLYKFILLGPSGLTRTELRRLIASGLLKSHYIKRFLGQEYIESLFDQLKIPSRASVREKALTHIDKRAGHYIDKWVEKASDEYEGIIRAQLLNHNQKIKTAVKEELPKSILENKSASAIKQSLKDKTGDLAKDWDRVVRTELAEVHNLGALDAIIENNKDKIPEEIFCYRVGPDAHDSRTCGFCKRFWFMGDGVTPRVYKLSELIENGTNIGRKSKDWLPTVGNTHPNERHLLLELPAGWGFKNGKLSYVRPGHSEYERQKSMGE